MIEVFYIYRHKDNFWTYESQKFSDPVKASRFCWSMKNNNNMILDGYASYSPSDLEYMDRKVDIHAINHSKIGLACVMKERR
jgi:hypothetical protein